MYKIAHIHVDIKFLHDSKKYIYSEFENLDIIITDDTVENFNGLIFNESKDSLESILKILNNYDLVIFVNLTGFGKKIIKSLPKDIKIFWRFFGYELYAQRLDQMLSEKSIVASKTDYQNNANILRRWGSHIKLKFINKKLFKRIDRILLFSEEEYFYLKKYWKDLPEFLRLPIVNDFNYKNYEKKNIVIVGNSRSIFNNHLDIIEIINQNSINNFINYKFFLSYGPKKNYFKFLIETIKDNKNFIVVDDFLSIEEYENIYKEASALVINANRQMALNNIFTALKYNCKVYLNDINSTKQWLLNKGIKIYDMQELALDIRNNNLRLSDEIAINNIENLKLLKNKYSQCDYCIEISKILNNAN